MSLVHVQAFLFISPSEKYLFKPTACTALVIVESVAFLTSNLVGGMVLQGALLERAVTYWDKPGILDQTDLIQGPPGSLTRYVTWSISWPLWVSVLPFLKWGAIILPHRVVRNKWDKHCLAHSRYSLYTYSFILHLYQPPGAIIIPIQYHIYCTSTIILCCYT